MSSKQQSCLLELLSLYVFVLGLFYVPSHDLCYTGRFWVLILSIHTALGHHHFASYLLGQWIQFAKIHWITSLLQHSQGMARCVALHFVLQLVFKIIFGCITIILWPSTA